MKKLCLLLAMIMMLGLAGCGKSETKTDAKKETASQTNDEGITEEEIVFSDIVKIELSNSEILVNGEEISEDTESAVYKANDIIFYLEDQGITYGEGTKKDEHSQIEANAHTVVHITEPGVYEVSGTLEAGQIFVDLGDGTKDEEEAVATIVLNNANITCTVAPAILFYRTYECAGDIEKEDAVMDVDTAAAGANIVLAEESKNKIYGSYVAEIYEEYELSEAFEDEEMAAMRNVAGEIEGAMAAMNFCVEQGIKSLLLHYDYEGVEKWCTGAWKCNKKGTIAYKAYYDSIKQDLQVVFHHVKGHSGVEGNERVDKLAKAALGL